MSDYINRQKLKEALCEDAINSLNCYSRDLMDLIIAEIDEAPSADVRPVVRGWWEPVRDPYGNLEGWIHKECGRITKEASAYCPTCGADMRG